ncbi:DUF3742 family protein [Alcaligenes nematophilus]|uniref:DUF3742 family protein n=1 Tax=Alcaligenes nematophilus TaxID=2994643 RepID=UPI0034E07405
MSTNKRISFAERLGRWAGRFWRGYVRQERRAAGWLAARGLPVGGAKALLWSVKLILLGVLLYAAFWLAVLLLFAVAVAWAAQHGAWGQAQADEEPEWRYGHEGFGLYDKDEWRLDGGDPDDCTE